MRAAIIEAADLLTECQRVLITTHVNPDGDAVGSTLALAEALRSSGARVDVALADSVPHYCRFLTGADTITSIRPSRTADVAIVCDAAGLDRIGDIDESVRAARQIIEIDHHAIARPFGHIRVVDSTAFATAEIIYHLLLAMEAPITPSIATSLMMGVVTDTGAFRFTNVSGTTFDLSSRLMEAGADLNQVVDQVYDQKSLSSLKLLERAIAHLEIVGSVAITSLSRSDFQASGAGQGEAEGIIGYLRSLRGVKVAAVLREVEPEEIRVSLRGRPGVNVAEIASVMGGGGHAAAAGCTIYLPLAEATAHLRQVVEQSFAAAGAAGGAA